MYFKRIMVLLLIILFFNCNYYEFNHILDSIKIKIEKNKNMEKKFIKDVFLEIQYIPFSTMTTVPVTKKQILKKPYFSIKIKTNTYFLNKDFRQIFYNLKELTKGEKIKKNDTDYRLYCKIYIKNFFIFKKKILEFSIGNNVIVNNKYKVENDKYFYDLINPFLPDFN